MANIADILQDSAWPDDYPASVGFVRRQLYMGRALVCGYLHDGEFYPDTDYDEPFVHVDERIFVDIPTGQAYRWGGSSYVGVSVTTSNDLAAVHYDAPDNKGDAEKAQARANIGAASQAALSTLTGIVGAISPNVAAWNAAAAKVNDPGLPASGSAKLTTAGQVFAWATAYFASLQVAWANVTGRPTTLAGYGIADAVKKVQVGTGTPVSPDGNGVVTLPAASISDPNALKIDGSQTLTSAQKSAVLAALGISGSSPAPVVGAAEAVAGYWSSHGSDMSNAEKTVLLERLVDYIIAKEGLS